MVSSNGTPNGNGKAPDPGDLGGGAFSLERRDLHKLHSLANDPRWVMPEHLREKLPAELARIALGQAAEGEEDKPSERHQLMAARVLVALEGQNQTDDHQIDKNRRLDAGLPTEGFALTEDERARVNRLTAAADAID